MRARVRVRHRVRIRHRVRTRARVRIRHRHWARVRISGRGFESGSGAGAGPGAGPGPDTGSESGVAAGFGAGCRLSAQLPAGPQARRRPRQAARAGGRRRHADAKYPVPPRRASLRPLSFAPSARPRPARGERQLSQPHPVQPALPHPIRPRSARLGGTSTQPTPPGPEKTPTRPPRPVLLRPPGPQASTRPALAPVGEACKAARTGPRRESPVPAAVGKPCTGPHSPSSGKSRTAAPPAAVGQVPYPGGHLTSRSSAAHATPRPRPPRDTPGRPSHPPPPPPWRLGVFSSEVRGRAAMLGIRLVAPPPRGGGSGHTGGCHAGRTASAAALFRPLR